MNRKRFFTGSLVGFLLLWRMVGFSTTALAGAAMARSIRPEVPSLAVRTGPLRDPGIPATGQGQQPVHLGGWQVYGLLGLGAMLLLLILLRAAKRSVSSSRWRRGPGKKR